ncbi:MAG: hypothetical protein JSS99_04155 [Actinobacteria bacterium]|nr:hypothetical protein [Actinomycetota bacterium]
MSPTAGSVVTSSVGAPVVARASAHASHASPCASSIHASARAPHQASIASSFQWPCMLAPGPAARANET